MPEALASTAERPPRLQSRGPLGQRGFPGVASQASTRDEGLPAFPARRHRRPGGFRGVAPPGQHCQVLCSHFTLKFLPLLSADTESFARPLPFTMVILTA